MRNSSYTYRFRGPLADPALRGGAAPVYRRTQDLNMIIERDVPVRLRDGTTMYVDVCRPEDEAPAAPIIGWGPYGKHGHTRYATVFPNAGVNQDALSPYTAFEALDPAWWVPKGYAIINPDPRGTWHSHGRATYVSPEETRDFCDLIEWAGTQRWSNGKVGLSGVSYLAVAQWFVAAEQPPHLAAINPWEGWSDTYRELVRHGGIPETSFWPYLPLRWGHSVTEIEDLLAEDAEHPLLDAFWQSKAAALEKITVPAFVVASWSDQGLHTRGTLEGFRRMSSPLKWLDVHGRKKWAYYYDPQAVARLRAFFDHFLLGSSAAVLSWPPVRLEVRERFLVGTTRAEKEWPIARTRYHAFYLDPGAGSLVTTAPEAESSVAYESASGRATFDFRFDTATDLVGHMKLRLWAAAQSAQDMDLFVAIQKLDQSGELVPFAFWAHFDDGPVALGWLRASHRELDAQRSTQWMPVLRHARTLPLTPAEPTPMDIEIWPSGTHFDSGETLRVVIQGRDIYEYPKPVMADRHEATVNAGVHRIFGGGRFDSHLLVPVI
jgi:predicted acyl esterase